jgi:2-C-methyl-D-erythritol 4-phosphate cytidylyltransferase
VKRADDNGRIIATVARDRLWRALTPQMFRYAALRQALERAQHDAITVTDEASAVEHAGGHPRLVTGHADNIKITHPGDLDLAEFFMHQQERNA